MGFIDWLHVIDSMKDGFYRLTETNKCTQKSGGQGVGWGRGSSAGKIFSYTDRAKVTRLLSHVLSQPSWGNNRLYTPFLGRTALCV